MTNHLTHANRFRRKMFVSVCNSVSYQPYWGYNQFSRKVMHVVWLHWYCFSEDCVFAKTLVQENLLDCLTFFFSFWDTSILLVTEMKVIGPIPDFGIYFHPLREKNGINFSFKWKSCQLNYTQEHQTNWVLLK